MGKYGHRISLLLIITHQIPEYEHKGRGCYLCGQVGDTSTLPIIQNLQNICEFAENTRYFKTHILLIKTLLIVSTVVLSTLRKNLYEYK